MTVEIRRACVEDAEAIAGVHIDCWRVAYRGLMSDEVLDALDMEESTRHWRGCMEETPLTFFVATVDGVVVGFCSLDPIGDEDTGESVGDLPSSYVLPSQWRQGIGRLLCEAVLAEATRIGLDELTLTVLDGNGGARDFFLTLGFQPDGT